MSDVADTSPAGASGSTPNNPTFHTHSDVASLNSPSLHATSSFYNDTAESLITTPLRSTKPKHPLTHNPSSSGSLSETSKPKPTRSPWKDSSSARILFKQAVGQSVAPTIQPPEVNNGFAALSDNTMFVQNSQQHPKTVPQQLASNSDSEYDMESTITDDLSLSGHSPIHANEIKEIAHVLLLQPQAFPIHVLRAKPLAKEFTNCIQRCRLYQTSFGKCQTMTLLHRLFSLHRLSHRL